MERLNLAAAYEPNELSIHLARYLAAQPLAKGCKILDLACGEGYGSDFLLKAGARSVTGVDRSKAAIAAATETFSAANLSFRAGDVDDLSAKELGRFDLIVCLETIEHVGDAQKFLTFLKSVAHKKTVFVISCPNDPYYYGRGKSLNPHHTRSFSWYDFRNLAEGALGEARWYFGTTLSGFGCFEAQPGAQPETYTEALDKIGDAAARIVPSGAQDEIRLRPSNALYYLGIWPKKAAVSAGQMVAFPSSGDYRQPVFSNASKAIRSGRKRRLALVADRQGWAFENIVKNIEGLLSTRYITDIYYVADFQGPNPMMVKLFLENSYDNVHFMWREFYFKWLTKPNLVPNLCKNRGISKEELADRVSSAVITTGIYDHLFLKDREVEERGWFFELLDSYSTSSEKLFDIYTEKYTHGPSRVTKDGVDLSFFKPVNLARLAEEDRPFRVGWAGNSEWAKTRGGEPKGVNTIIRPALALCQLNRPIEEHFADRSVTWRPREDMPAYYSEIDVLVCASSIEGTPNPVLEAMACGVPVISTDVGIVREVMGPQQQKFILPERTPEALAAMLSEIASDPDLRQRLSAENIAEIQKHAWDTRIIDWLSLMRVAEDRHDLTQGLKRAVLQRHFQSKLVTQVSAHVQLKHSKFFDLLQTIRSKLP